MNALKKTQEDLQKGRQKLDDMLQRLEREQVGCHVHFSALNLFTGRNTQHCAAVCELAIINKRSATVHGPCCIKNGLLTLACVKLTRLLSYFLSNISMPFCLSSVLAKLIVSLNIYVPHNRLFSSFFHFLCAILLGVLLYNVHVI